MWLERENKQKQITLYQLCNCNCFYNTSNALYYFVLKENLFAFILNRICDFQKEGFEMNVIILLVWSTYCFQKFHCASTQHNNVLCKLIKQVKHLSYQKHKTI